MRPGTNPGCAGRPRVLSARRAAALQARLRRTCRPPRDESDARDAWFRIRDEAARWQATENWKRS